MEGKLFFATVCQPVFEVMIIQTFAEDLQDDRKCALRKIRKMSYFQLCCCMCYTNLNVQYKVLNVIIHAHFMCAYLLKVSAFFSFECI